MSYSSSLNVPRRSAFRRNLTVWMIHTMTQIKSRTPRNTRASQAMVTMPQPMFLSSSTGGSVVRGLFNFNSQPMKEAA